MQEERKQNEEDAPSWKKCVQGILRPAWPSSNAARQMLHSLGSSPSIQPSMYSCQSAKGT